MAHLSSSSTHRPPRRCFSARSADSSTSPPGGSRTCSEVSVDARVRACHADLRRGMLRGHRASRRDSSAGRARLRPGRVGWCGCGALCCVSGAAFTAASIGASSTIGSTSTSSASRWLVGRPGRCAARSYASISRCERVLYVGDACIWGGALEPKLRPARARRQLYTCTGGQVLSDRFRTEYHRCRYIGVMRAERRWPAGARAPF